MTMAIAPNASATITGHEAAVKEIQLTETVPIKILADYRKQGYSGVIDLGTYTYVDDDAALQATNEQLDGNAKDKPKGNCSTIIKPLMINGKKTLVMGRTLDLPSSHYPAYVFRINQPGKYKTANMGYVNFAKETFDQIAKTSTIDKGMYDMLPYTITDVVNEKGLAIEINMRDTCKTLNATGTNPGKKRISSATLPRYLADHCATIEEALKALNELDIYTPSGSNVELSWHLAYNMMDATGRHGILEFIKNKPVWHEGYLGQTNFWVDQAAGAEANTDEGLGRWSVLMRNYNYIKTQQDMYQTMKKVWYGQLFSKDAKDMSYDPISEMINEDVQSTIDQVMGWKKQYGIKVDKEALAQMQAIAKEQKDGNITWNKPYILNPDNQQKVYAVIDFITHAMNQLPAEGLKTSGLDEVSALTYTINTQDKTYHVHFFEQDQEFVYGVEK